LGFETFLTHAQRRPRLGRRITLVLSLGLHAAVLLGVAAYSFAHVDELSMPNVPVVLFRLVPPPPPPPAAARQRTVSRTKRRPTEIVQPDRPRVVQPPEPPDQDDDVAGVPGGVTGGVPGGVAGGEGPAPARAEATFLPLRVATGRLAINPYDAPYRARLPPALAKAGMSLWAMLKVCVDPDGRVVDVKIIKSADPTLDPNIIAALKTWRYHPYTLNGRAVPFCTIVRYEISSL
jgi:protein TonB